MSALIDLVPVTRTGEEGVRIITTPERKDAAVAANLEHWIAAGYVRCYVEDHVPTQAFGDKRRWGWRRAGDGQ